MTEQRFNTGDHVRIASVMPWSMGHFPHDCEAIVLGSYEDEYGHGITDSYSVYIPGRGSVSWYNEDQLTLIAENRCDLLKEWRVKDRLAVGI